jgi:hypothetical protein
MKAKNLRGDRNQCTACERLFNSALAFDKHRTGKHEGGNRRCPTVAEMTAKGMVLRDDGFWRGSEFKLHAKGLE